MNTMKTYTTSITQNQNKTNTCNFNIIFMWLLLESYSLH